MHGCYSLSFSLLFQKSFQEANPRSLKKKVRLQDHNFVAKGPYVVMMIDSTLRYVIILATICMYVKVGLIMDV